MLNHLTESLIPDVLDLLETPQLKELPQTTVEAPPILFPGVSLLMVAGWGYGDELQTFFREALEMDSFVHRHTLGRREGKLDFGDIWVHAHRALYLPSRLTQPTNLPALLWQLFPDLTRVVTYDVQGFGQDCPASQVSALVEAGPVFVLGHPWTKHSWQILPHPFVLEGSNARVLPFFLEILECTSVILLSRYHKDWPDRSLFEILMEATFFEGIPPQLPKELTSRLEKRAPTSGFSNIFT